MSETKAKQTKAAKAAVEVVPIINVPKFASDVGTADSINGSVAYVRGLAPARNNALAKVRADVALAMVSNAMKGDIVAMRGTTSPEQMIARYRWFYDRLDFIEAAAGTEG